jgi:hypothetical protein
LYCIRSTIVRIRERITEQQNVFFFVLLVTNYELEVKDLSIYEIHDRKVLSPHIVYSTRHNLDKILFFSPHAGVHLYLGASGFLIGFVFYFML